MTDLVSEINELAEYFREIEVKVSEIKKEEIYKEWIEAPLPEGQSFETKE